MLSDIVAVGGEIEEAIPWGKERNLGSTES